MACRRSFFVAAFLLVAMSAARPQQVPSVQPASVVLSDAILSRVPAAYRDEAKSLLTATAQQQSDLQAGSDEGLAGWVIAGLAQNRAAASFLLSQLEKEPSPKLRADILQFMRLYWQTHPEARAILEGRAASDSDVGVSLVALDVLRSIRMDALGKVLETRLAAAKSAGDSAGIKSLGLEEEQWSSLKQKILLPAFLRVPPAVFSVRPVEKAVRVLAFGDFGTGSPEQIRLAATMVAYSKKNPFDLGITLGDNFYPLGMVSTNDPRWQSQWEQLYGPLRITFYPCFGSHDWYQDSPAAEILYSQRSPDWNFPAPYYTFTAGPVQFFALNTSDVSQEQLSWLDEAITKSQARWKIVYGHNPIYAANADSPALVEKLLPILKDRVDVYISGHRHNLEAMRAEAGIHFFVTGGGGAPLDSLKPDQRALFAEHSNGFTVLEANRERVKISFIDADGHELYSETIGKEADDGGRSARKSREPSKYSGPFSVCVGEGCSTVYKLP